MVLGLLKLRDRRTAPFGTRNLLEDRCSQEQERWWSLNRNGEGGGRREEGEGGSHWKGVERNERILLCPISSSADNNVTISLLPRRHGVSTSTESPHNASSRTSRVWLRLPSQYFQIMMLLFASN